MITCPILSPHSIFLFILISGLNQLRIQQPLPTGPDLHLFLHMAMATCMASTSRILQSGRSEFWEEFKFPKMTSLMFSCQGRYKVCIKSLWTVVWFSQIVNCLHDYHPEGSQFHTTDKISKKVQEIVYWCGHWRPLVVISGHNSNPHSSNMTSLNKIFVALST